MHKYPFNLNDVMIKIQMGSAHVECREVYIEVVHKPSGTKIVHEGNEGLWPAREEALLALARVVDDEHKPPDILDLIERHTGALVRLGLKDRRMDLCPQCGGYGKKIHSSESFPTEHSVSICPVCKGLGLQAFGGGASVPEIDVWGYSNVEYQTRITPTSNRYVIRATHKPTNTSVEVTADDADVGREKALDLLQQRVSGWK